MSFLLLPRYPRLHPRYHNSLRVPRWSLTVPSKSFAHQNDCPLPLWNSKITLRSNIQKPANQHISQRKELAKRKANSNNPTSSQSIESIRMLQGQQASSQGLEDMPLVADARSMPLRGEALQIRFPNHVFGASEFTAEEDQS